MRGVSPGPPTVRGRANTWSFSKVCTTQFDPFLAPSFLESSQENHLGFDTVGEMPAMGLDPSSNSPDDVVREPCPCTGLMTVPPSGEKAAAV